MANLHHSYSDNINTKKVIITENLGFRTIEIFKKQIESIVSEALQTYATYNILLLFLFFFQTATRTHVLFYKDTFSTHLPTNNNAND